MTRHEPVGYTYHADIYCSDCAEKYPQTDPEGNDKFPIFDWDTNGLRFDNDGETIFSSCGDCGEPANEW